MLLFDLVQDVPHAFLLGLHVEGVVFVGLDLERDALHDLKAIGLEADALDGVIAHQAHLADAELLEDLRPDAVVTFVGLVPEVEVGIDGVEALFLELVGAYLLHQTDATALLVEVDDEAAALLLDELHGLVQLLAALAAHRAEDVPCGAAGVDAHQYGLAISDVALQEGDVLEAGMLNKSVERAQKKVEENNFGIRKRLLEYDDVMNSQRNVIYTRRRHALMGERIGLDVMNTLYDATVALVEQARETADFDGFKLELFRTFALECPVTEETFREAKTDALTEQVFKAVMEQYKRRTERMAQVADPVIRQVFENQGAMYENIMIPVTDGKRMYNVSCNLKEAYDTHSRAIVKAFQKAVTLLTIDEAWKEHLRDMDDLRQSVQNASYENKDPLLIYKLEAYNLFKTMVETMNRKTVAILMRGQIPVQEAPDEERQAAPEVRQAVPERRTDMSRYRTEKDDADAAPRSADSEGTQPQPPTGPAPRQPQEPVRVEKKVGRNDPCPCGSGKKYKNCHGRGL